MTELQWRPPIPADIPLLAAMNQQLIRAEGHRNPMTLAQLEERMAGFLAGAYEAAIFVAERPAGYALWRPEPDHVYLRQFFIAPKYRRRGFGRKAIALLRQDAWPRQTRLRLEVLVGNESGIAFWRSIGLEPYCLTMEMAL